MQKEHMSRWLKPAAILLGLWLGLKYLLPVLLPFLLGGLLAIAAEPVVDFSVRRLRLPRAAATGLGVTLTLLLMICVLSLVGALAVKELGRLAYALPDMQQTAQQGMGLLKERLLQLAERMPEGLGSIVSGSVQELFYGGTNLLERMGNRVPALLGAALGHLPGSALGAGTGLLAGFMISARLPQLRAQLGQKLPARWRTGWKTAREKLRTGVGGWLRAQLKLVAVTYGVVAVGLLLLGIAYGPLWAVLVAIVDAVPVLGTGTVLLPWALIELLRGSHLRALGLVAVYAVALLLRTVLEPRLVGKQLGIDPLMTLLAMYLGFRFWGLIGMILAPVLTVAVKGQVATDH